MNREARVTIQSINQAIRKIDPESELVKGHGYFYFRGGIADKFEGQGVYAYHLTDLSLDEWVGEFKEKRNQNGVEWFTDGRNSSKIIFHQGKLST